MIDVVSKRTIRQGLDVADAAISARVAARTDSKATAFTAPSESEFASAVVKDMAGGLFSSRPVLWIAVGVVVIVLVGVVWLTLR